jgi:hypothetical protein
VASPDRAALVVKLQILVAVTLPLVLIAVWLSSREFFQPIPGS